MGEDLCVVLGAGGGTGVECVKRLLELGWKVKAGVRDPGKYGGVFGEHRNLEVSKVDVTRAEDVKGCMRGARAVMFTASGSSFLSPRVVDNEAVGMVADAAKNLGVDRVLLVSSCFVTPKNRFKPIRMMLNNFKHSLMDHKFHGEEKLRQSGVPFTVVRPGRLTDNPGGALFETGQGDRIRGMISRADVAAVCCAALTDPNAENRTFELVSKPNQGDISLNEQLKTVFDNLVEGNHT